MKTKVIIICQYLLGAIFFVFGLNGLLMAFGGKGFMPMPPLEPRMATIMAGFAATGYLLKLVKIIEVTAGLLLLANRYVPAAIVLLGPVVVNILGIHMFASHEGLPMAVVVVALWSVLVKKHWTLFKPLLSK
ncbi:MAG: hypothetical protein R3A11_02100 [Bdellovibrionota bacterium]